MAAKKWYQYIPHPVVMLLGMLVIASILSYILPAGSFERVALDGRLKVVAGSYKEIPSDPVSWMEMFMCLPLGFKTAVDIIFIVLSSGIMFGFMEHSGAIEHGVGTLIRRLGVARKYLIVVLMTFLFGMLGVFVGYENNIALVPIACLLSLALGGDLMLAAGISVGAVTVGFGVSPFNAYTVGTAHKVAELPLFSGALLRSILCIISLSVMAWYNVRYFKKITNRPEESLASGIDTDGFILSKPVDDYRMSFRHWMILGVFFSSIVLILYGVFNHDWFINQISAVFCMVVAAIALIERISGAEFGKILLRSVAVVAPGAFMVGLATSIKIALETGHISDTIAYHLSETLLQFPLYVSAVGMAVAQTFMNFVIPSGSGQALATLPVMIPVGELIGITRQSAVLAFQIGDGVSNLINPSLGGIIAMLSLCRIPFDRWLRFIFPLFIMIWLISIVFLIVSVLIGYGPY
jgi:uncharacterized ion transporter superfamily protein YfcC